MLSQHCIVIGEVLAYVAQQMRRKVQVQAQVQEGMLLP